MTPRPSESSSGSISVSINSLADQELSNCWKDDSEASQVEAALESQMIPNEARGKEQGIRTQPKRVAKSITKTIIPQKIGPPNVKSTINHPVPIGVNIFGVSKNHPHESLSDGFIGPREEEKVPLSPQVVPGKTKPRNDSVARRKALDELAQQHRVPGQFTAELARDEITTMESVDKWSRMEPKDVDKAVHSILPSLHLEL